MQPIGLYIHTPFCVSKCPYCDFYSLPLGGEEQLDAYVTGVMASMERWAEKAPVTADTLYFGGGTPALLGGARLAALIKKADVLFGLLDNHPEITLEANPADNLANTLAAFAAAGGNRLSLGMQSAVPAELALLGRRHTPADVERTVSDARRAGLENVSLDVMLGISGQTEKTALTSVERAADLGATHVSAYLLKLEPDTPFGHCPPPLPGEDATADLYLAAMERLDALGYHQYEISNTAKPGHESRHNLKYWDSRPYLGLGPAASSCFLGRRFTYPRDTAYYLAGGAPVDDPAEGPAVGSPAEYALLRLRLTEGLTEEGFCRRYGTALPAGWRDNATRLPRNLVTVDETGIRLTREGFLLSNYLICTILEE
ncbi:MAG: radical SAM family heme chaperone HemW [Ruminococcaceae bacterium]|nr:radical SAM family heme chaperone HemW [Oscillospiraceae bacterium]